MKIKAAKEHSDSKVEQTKLVGSFQIEAAAKGEDGKSKNPRFSMTAYTGKAMSLWGFYHPVVVELSGLQVPSQQRPILLNHINDPEYVMGQTDSIKIVNGELIASGEIMGVSEKAKQAIQLAQNGFAFQASIGASILSREFIEAGQKGKANGQEFSGPVNIVRASRLGEISFVALGADDDTSASIAAGQYLDKDFLRKENAMNKQELITAILANAKNTHTAEQLDGMDEKGLNELLASLGKVEVKATATPATVPAAAGVDDATKQMRANAATEQRRIAAIQGIRGISAEVAAKAIEDGSDPRDVELSVLRAQTPKVTGIIMQNRDTTPQVIEAAVLMAGGISGNDLIKTHTQKAVEAADKQFRGRIGLQQILLEAAWANGCAVRHFREDERRVMEAAFPIRAAFSTFSLPGILGNVVNKFLLQGFMSVESVWRKIAAIRNVSDFKAITSYRLNGGFEYQEVGPDGELKHGSLSEDSFTNQAKTYGIMYAITRQNIINDDLGALTDVPKRIGRGGALKFNKVFWLEFLDNSSFFTAGRNNFDDGADTALQFDAFTLAETLFLNQTDPDGNPLAVIPRTLLVPPALKSTAEMLMKAMEIRDTTASKKTPTANIHAGKAEVACSSYLSNSAMTGYSTTGWYLLADQNDVPVIEAAFLNGKQEPTVESAEANFNTLGIEMRGYHDFGVTKQEYRGGVKMKGTT